MINLSDEKQRLALFYKIRGAAITVEKNLGPYMIEKYYEKALIMELKASPRVEKPHMRQLLTYMRLMQKHYGLIINFGVSFISKYGMKAMVLSNFDDVINANSDFDDKIGLVAFT